MKAKTLNGRLLCVSGAAYSIICNGPAPSYAPDNIYDAGAGFVQAPSVVVRGTSQTDACLIGDSDRRRARVDESATQRLPPALPLSDLRDLRPSSNPRSMSSLALVLSPFLLKTIALVIYASEFCGSNCNTRLQSARAFS